MVRLASRRHRTHTNVARLAILDPRLVEGETCTGQFSLSAFYVRPRTRQKAAGKRSRALEHLSL